MLVVARLAVPEARQGELTAVAGSALAALASRPGYISGRLGRATDDPTAWVLVLEFASVGTYRRALSAYDVKVHATPLLTLARDEPSAYEVLLDDSGIVAPSDRAEQ